MPLRTHRTYNRVSVTQDADATPNPNNDSPLIQPLSPASSSHDLEDSRAEADAVNSVSSTALFPSIRNEIHITLLDGAHAKFSIACDPSWKVSQLKTASAIVTKVPPESQRLIHMGKLLQDSKTLEESGINQNDTIVHLFPKPNVVINPPSNSNADDARGENESQAANNTTSDNNRNSEGAHIPQIIINADEAARRSQILILSSQEIFEAQHRVKIFSFLLMIITSMELLTLMTLYVGVDDESYPGSGSSGEIPPGNPTDALPTNDNNGTALRTWQSSDYADVIISAFGFYVSLLGIKATTENTLLLARRYLICLVIAGIASNIYYYYLNVNQMTKSAEERNQSLDDASLYGGSFLGILLPLTVWTLCILRAYQFQLLIREAEVEAEERTNAVTTSNVANGGEGVSLSLWKWRERRVCHLIGLQ
ncbi:hypothetical protein HJC23_010188 [Cyclotella cryptica]|uniref:Ubiquitin-like domain-containing protein n=1 Tax=Cyclotella cryptica TaxID=29204 RepID=A0ABD3PGE0_9STRA|eukprot:CCRYP_014708-RA/>CCRYP_014708-RA protein AED:0.42 eAED:0.42 QI:0/-1/0/1/-1/1/1/0/423